MAKDAKKPYKPKGIIQTAIDFWTPKLNPNHPTGQAIIKRNDEYDRQLQELGMDPLKRRDK